MAILKFGSPNVVTFSMVQSSDHHTPLTSAAPVVNISKNAGAFSVATNSPATEIGGTGNGHGWYQIVLTNADLNTVGDLSYFITATSGDPLSFKDQVQTFVFSDLNIDTSGNVSIASSIKRNQALTGFMFLMTNSATHQPQTGLTVTAQRSLAGAGFAPCANAVTELSNGVYTINLGTTDTNANSILYRFTATGADDLDLLILTQP